MVKMVNTKRQILYAEDNPSERERFVKLIDQNFPDCEVETFDNGLQLINHLLSIKNPSNFPSHIVLDLFMPSWNGLQTLKALKADEMYKSIPVSIVTASSDEQDIKWLQQAGASTCASKPLTQVAISALLQ